MLQQSPVLREVFQRSESRFADRVTLVWAGFHRDAMLLLLKFLYTGEVGECELS